MCDNNSTKRENHEKDYIRVTFLLLAGIVFI